jgi:Bifunctional DNA primase/polymerase, N-terminal
MPPRLGRRVGAHDDDEHGKGITQAIPIRRRLVRLNPLARSRGQVAVFRPSRGFDSVPCHWPLETGEDPVCSCSLLQRPYREDHSTEAGRKRIGKDPFGRLVGNWKEGATSDPHQIRQWLYKEPNLNFGLVTGRPHLVTIKWRGLRNLPGGHRRRQRPGRRRASENDHHAEDLWRW